MDVLTYGLLNKKVEEAKNVSGEKITEAVNTYLDENPVAPGATSEQAEQIQDNTNKISELKSDLANSKKAIAELNDKKITKFYASNLGETHLTDSDNGKIMDMMVYGKSEQKQYSGKNLLSPVLKSQTTNGITCVDNGNGTYTFTGTATNKASFKVYGSDNVSSEVLKEFTNKKIVGCPSSGGTDKYFLRASDNITYAYTDFGQGAKITTDIRYIYIQFEKGVTVSRLIFKPMITDDLDVTYDDFEPYLGGQPSPSPDYPQEINSIVNPIVKINGKNLLNLDGSISNGIASDVTNGYCINLSGTAKYNWSNITSSNVTNKYNLEIGKTYVFSISKPLGFVVGIKFFDDLVGNNQTARIIIGDTSVAITITKYTKNIQIFLEKLVVGTEYNDTFEVQLESGSVSTDIEPYTEQLASLPYTLNAIPVSSGGNVTIDGQEYIADYVDIENKKLVRNVSIVDLGTLEPELVTEFGNIVFRYFSLGKNLPPNFSKKSNVITESYKSVGNVGSWSSIIKKGDNVIGTVSVGNEYGFIISASSFTDINSFKQAMAGSMICYELATPTITDLTPEEVQAFKELATYYPTTNVIVTSDQLDGYTTFNYPLSMSNGWNLIKEQLGDTREYIYDMELQSAEAYVNSEYAVTLTELGV